MEAVMTAVRGAVGINALAWAMAAALVAVVAGTSFALLVGSPTSLAVFIGLCTGVCTASMPWTFMPPKTFQARLWTAVGTCVIVGAALVGVYGVEMASPGSVSALILLVGFAGFMSGFAAACVDLSKPVGSRSGD
jgi:hypothetical protein